MESMLPVRDPGATRAPLDPNAMNTRERMVGSVRAKLGGSSFSNEIAINGYREYFVYDDKFDNVSAQRQYPFFIFDANFLLHSTLQRGGAEYTGHWSGGTGTLPVSLAWGALVQRESLSDRTVYEGNPGSAEFDRNGGALFAEGSIVAASRLNVLAGARIERFGDVTSDVTPRISAVFAALPGRVSVRVAGGTAYKAPNLQEQYADNPFIAGNPDLKPETSSSAEVGLDLRGMNGRVALGVTAFRQDYENQIRTVALEGTEKQINRNLGASRASGVEWELRLNATQAWAVGVDGTALSTEVIDNTGLSADAYPEGEALPFRPDLTASAFVEHGGPKLKGMLRLRYIGEQTVLTERFGGARVALDPYLVAGANVTWAVARSFDVHVRADNLFDKRYETAFDRQGAPARVSLGLTWRSR
jgi:vitamin B12 transporter